MPSSSGKASEAPRPRSTVRRGRVFFVIIIFVSSAIALVGYGAAAAPASDALRIRNGLLSTIPRISEDQR